jgi:hypothetical protein
MTELVFRNDKGWRVIDGEPCRVKAFDALAEITDGRVSAATRDSHAKSGSGLAARSALLSP